MECSQTMGKTVEWKENYIKEYHKFWIKKEGIRIQHKESIIYHNLFLKRLHQKKGDKILDCGIGTGEPLAIKLAKKGCKVYGVDISKELIKKCNNNFKSVGLNNMNVTGDIDNLPFKNNTFDKVYSSSAIWRTPSLNKSLKELFRVTKNGGYFIFDVVNIFHITVLINFLITKFKKCINLPTENWNFSTPFKMKRLLEKLSVDYSFEGYFILLPTGLPLLGRLGHLCRFSNTFSFKLSKTKLKYLANKLVYVCKKR